MPQFLEKFGNTHIACTVGFTFETNVVILNDLSTFCVRACELRVGALKDLLVARGGFGDGAHATLSPVLGRRLDRSLARPTRKNRNELAMLPKMFAKKLPKLGKFGPGSAVSALIVASSNRRSSFCSIL